MKIFFDCDGVLSDFTDNMGAVANELWPGKLPPGYSPTDWDYTGIFTKQEWNQVWEEIKVIPNFWLRSIPIWGAVFCLETWLQKTKHEVFYITSRMPTGGVDARSQTQLWLHKYCLYPRNRTPTVIAVDHPSDKADLVAKLGIDFGIDDYPPTVHNLNAVPGHKCYLLDKTYNQESSEPRVKSLQQFLEIVDAY